MERTTASRSSSRRPPSSPPCTPFSKGLTIRSPRGDPAATTTGQEPLGRRTPSARRKSNIQLDFGPSSSSVPAAAVEPAAAPKQAAAAAAATPAAGTRSKAASSASASSSSAATSAQAQAPVPPPRVEAVSFVLKLKTQDLAYARQAVAYARGQKRPLLLQGLLSETVKGYTPDQLQLLPEDVKVCSDDKSGIGFQPLRDWGVAPKRLRKATSKASSSTSESSSSSGISTGDDPAMPSNWGRIASIMSEKAPQARLWTRFMQDDLSSFRASTGHTALAAFAASVFEDRPPMSCNVIVTGNAPPSAAGRCYELKSDAHQDEYDNFMLVSSGSKIWALAALTEEEVAKGRKTKGKLSSSFRLDAVDRTKNKTVEEHEIAGLFETVWMGPGDVLFNPAWVWHQVNSEPQTLAYSVMYPLDRKERDTGRFKKA